MPFFPINIISVCIKLARGHLCFSITCRFFFLPSHCISAALNLSSLNDWSEWEVGLGIRGKRTMRALAVLELPFSPFMRWGGPFAEWDVKKVTADLFWKCFFPPFSFFFFSFFQITWLCPQTPRFPVDRGLIQCYFGCLLPPWISFFPQLSCPPPILSLVPPVLSVLCSLSDCFQGAHSQGLEEGSSDVIHA